MSGGHGGGHESHGGGGGHSKKEDMTGWAIFIGVTNSWDPTLTKMQILKDALFHKLPEKIEPAFRGLKEQLDATHAAADGLSGNAEVAVRHLNSSFTEQLEAISKSIEAGQYEAASAALEPLSQWTTGVTHTLESAGNLFQQLTGIPNFWIQGVEAGVSSAQHAAEMTEGGSTVIAHWAEGVGDALDVLRAFTLIG